VIDLWRALVAVPTYNEAENVEPLVEAVLAQDARLEALVIDDASPDGTGDIADALAVADARVHVMHRPRKMGLGSAYVSAFEWALGRGYDLIFEMDCDFSHDPIDLPRFLVAIERADMVLGSRYIQGGRTPDWGLHRRLISLGGNLLSRLLLRLRTHDCTGGYRCYRADLLRRVPLDQIRAQGYAFQVGMVYHVERLGGKVLEIPITFRDRRVGESKMSSGIVREALVYVVHLALSNTRGDR